jgi:hypothetical protein
MLGGGSAAAGGAPIRVPIPVPADVEPPLANAWLVRPAVYDDGCHQGQHASLVPRCVYGDPGGATTIVLFGDSHASQWFPPIEHFALAHHDRLVSLTHSWCPAAIVALSSPSRAACDLWRRRALRRIRRERPDLVVIGSMPPALVDADDRLVTDPDDHARIWRAGYDAVLRRLHTYTSRIVVLSDSVMTTDVPKCLAVHLHDAEACATARDESIDPIQVGIEHTLADQDDIGLITTTAWTCPSDPCPGIIGRVLVWRDEIHLTPVVTELFKARIAHALTKALRRPGSGVLHR